MIMDDTPKVDRTLECLLAQVAQPERLFNSFSIQLARLVPLPKQI